MLDFVFRPLRSLIGLTEREVVQETRIAETEGHILGAVQAIRSTTESIEHQVEMIDQLASAVGPLTESVNQLNATMTDLVAVLHPLATAERDVHRLGRLFSRHHDDPSGGSEETTPGS